MTELQLKIEVRHFIDDTAQLSSGSLLLTMVSALNGDPRMFCQAVGHPASERSQNFFYRFDRGDVTEEV